MFQEKINLKLDTETELEVASRVYNREEHTLLSIIGKDSSGKVVSASVLLADEDLEDLFQVLKKARKREKIDFSNLK